MSFGYGQSRLNSLLSCIHCLRASGLSWAMFSLYGQSQSLAWLQLPKAYWWLLRPTSAQVSFLRHATVCMSTVMSHKYLQCNISRKWTHSPPPKTFHFFTIRYHIHQVTQAWALEFIFDSSLLPTASNQTLILEKRTLLESLLCARCCYKGFISIHLIFTGTLWSSYYYRWVNCAHICPILWA